MAMTGKLNKLKCMIKRWHSSGRISGRGASSSAVDEEEHQHLSSASSFHGADVVPAGLHPVYVGRSRRRYLVAADLLRHPLFKVLVERTGGDLPAASGGGTVVGCEVVLFEHLLWMLENAEPPPESLDELVDYYACS
ncbi:auxin-responsive protein SAUR78-like [Zingiber officinale]|uniref:SAUR family protein n=1 Tax=Zingiber officinale TaxID=94328 RepID=A0A8J5G7R9_ZINOF|nr:auxin-responsive protein SAUR78-like [Zingiber officinale]XP_042404467.1 auxin-responsive protein SAUR78-like [Zingiber officinale]KAG6502068.1 hypothetical protein ZIOFF_041955 [Zingiber officinale]